MPDRPRRAAPGAAGCSAAGAPAASGRCFDRFEVSLTSGPSPGRLRRPAPARCPPARVEAGGRWSGRDAPVLDGRVRRGPVASVAADAVRADPRRHEEQDGGDGVTRSDRRWLDRPAPVRSWREHAPEGVGAMHSTPGRCRARSRVVTFVPEGGSVDRRQRDAPRRALDRGTGTADRPRMPQRRRRPRRGRPLRPRVAPPSASAAPRHGGARPQPATAPRAGSGVGEHDDVGRRRDRRRSPRPAAVDEPAVAASPVAR